MMNLGELPNGTSRSDRTHHRNDLQVWRPRDASSNQRPPWASIGHHAMVAWQSSSRFDNERTIRVVDASERSEYDVGTDSIWGPLEVDNEPLLTGSEREEDDHGDEFGCPADWLRTPKARASQPPMPVRCPPSPPISGPGQHDRVASLERDLERERHPSSATAKKRSRFIEHVDENAEMLKKLGISYDEGRRRGIGNWFNSLTRR